MFSKSIFLIYTQLHSEMAAYRKVDVRIQKLINKVVLNPKKLDTDNQKYPTINPTDKEFVYRTSNDLHNFEYTTPNITTNIVNQSRMSRILPYIDRSILSNHINRIISKKSSDKFLTATWKE